MVELPNYADKKHIMDYSYCHNPLPPRTYLPREGFAVKASGVARSGATTIDGVILLDARRENSSTYHEVHETELGHLCCLGAEVFGRWGDDPIDIMPKMVRERCRGVASERAGQLEGGLVAALVGVARRGRAARSG